MDSDSSSSDEEEQLNRVTVYWGTTSKRTNNRKGQGSDGDVLVSKKALGEGCGSAKIDAHAASTAESGIVCFAGLRRGLSNREGQHGIL